MIERIEIAGCASYGNTVESMDGLSCINFVYGPNGAGKTTISRLIDDADPFSSCAVHWHAGIKLEAMVYNRDFVHNNFNANVDLKGIFTLGAKDIDTQNKLYSAKKDADDLRRKIEQLQQTLHGPNGTGGKRAELLDVETSFKDECWKVMKKHEAKLQGAFTGYRNDKQKFKENILRECLKTSVSIPTQSDLEAKAASLFGPTPALEVLLPSADGAILVKLENDPLLRKRVIGRVDVDIAAIILKLGNSDWVQQGVPFYEASDGTCPFCQQRAPEQLANQLASYFDDVFITDTAQIAAIKDAYLLEGDRIKQLIQNALTSNPRFLDVVSLASLKAILDARLLLNQQRIASKAKEPSLIVTVDSVASVMAEIKQVLLNANQKIAEHNATVSNLEVEKRKLTNLVWAFLAHVEITPEFAKYQNKKSGVQSAITSILSQIASVEADLKHKESEIKALEKATTSVQPTITDINNLLNAFGFHSFSVQAAGQNLYKIQRADGTDAKDTLSEGERSFITFLYFYHLLKGSKTGSGVTTDRVVVFDDPVSSLDSDVLFVVSSLIRKTLEEVRSKKANIKQVFILTHNVYFHKEIAYTSKRSGDATLKDETFWTIRKHNGVSRVKKHSKNPIKSSYDLLWTDVRENNVGSSTIQNTLRRILESYFTLLGGISFDDILGQFSGEDKVICKSLLSWIHDGSHSVLDDVFVALDESMIEKYLGVFKKVFVNMGQISHYNMMMGGAPRMESRAAVPQTSGTAGLAG